MDDPEGMMFSPIRFNPEQLEVECNGKTVRLTPNEARTLYFLATHANTACTVDQICSWVYDFDNYDGSATLVKVAIRHLRQKIELDPTNPAYILTVPSGYALVMNPHE